MTGCALPQWVHVPWQAETLANNNEQSSDDSVRETESSSFPDQSFSSPNLLPCQVNTASPPLPSTTWVP